MKPLKIIFSFLIFGIQPIYFYTVWGIISKNIIYYIQDSICMFEKSKLHKLIASYYSKHGFSKRIY